MAEYKQHNHMWVKLQMTPLAVSVTNDGGLKIAPMETSLQLTEDEAKVGCWFCHTPLNEETFHTECPGDET